MALHRSQPVTSQHQNGKQHTAEIPRFGRYFRGLSRNRLLLGAMPRKVLTNYGVFLTTKAPKDPETTCHVSVQTAEGERAGVNWTHPPV